MGQAGASVIGRSIERIDGLEKVTGRRRYAADVPLPGALWGRVLRSPFPHARIRRVDASAAWALPGVRAVLTAADLPATRIGRRLYDMTVLARDRVRFVGEKVAAVAAEDPDTAEEALRLIQVEYEELPAVFDPLEAMRPDAPVLHPDLPTYRHVPPLPPIPNVHSYARWGRGNVERGFAEAELVFEDTFFTPMQHPGFLEPHTCAVWVEPDGRARVWTSNKQPFHIRDWLAEAVGVPADWITVCPVSVGGDFGGKGYLVDEPLAYHLSRASGRPVRMVMSYAEELAAGVPRHAAIVTIRTGVTRDGRLVASHARLVFNSGAYAGNKPHPLANLSGAEAACGVYHTPHTLIESFCVYTNQLPCGHMRAPGWVQASFAAESHLDMLAARLGLDPLELRLRNVVGPDDEAPTGDRWRGARAREVLERAAELAGWGRRPTAAAEAPGEPAVGRGSHGVGADHGTVALSPRHAPLARVGRGLSLTYEHIGTGRSGAVVSVDERGGVRLLTGVPDVGTGAHTIFRQLVAEVLTIAPDAVAVEIGDTARAPFDSGSGGDRVTNVAGHAVVQATEQLRDRLCALAAELLGWREGGVRLVDGAFCSDSGDGGVPFRELAARAARASGGRVEVHHELRLEARATERNFTAQVAEVEVDEESGQVRLQRLVSVQDIGTVLNPRLAEGQVEGGAICGLGYALLEELRVEDGRVLTASLGDYRLPSAADVPELRQAFLPSGEGPLPFGAKPVGEVSLCGVAPAVANAIYDAVGARLTELPLSAERVRRALRARE